MGKLKIKQKKKTFIPYTNQQAHMFAQSIQNCQKELKEMELKAFDDGFINDINSGKTSLSEMVDNLEKKHHIRICDDYKELIKRYGV